MSVAYKAEDTQLRRTVALKFLPRETLDEEEVKARLIREAQAAASLDHPNICHVYGIHEEDGETFIAMAYIDGPSLAEKVKERPLPLDAALTIATQIAEGLHEAHEQGVVHRDIKPQNILLNSKGQVKILDFGLASLTGRSKLTKTGTTMGTPAYMSPEQLEGKNVDRRADVWALGCVLYEMLTQKTPFEADYEQAIGYGILNEDPEPVTALRSGLPTKVDDLLAKALTKDRDERYQHVDDMLADLRVLQKRSSGAQKTLSSRMTIAPTTGQTVSAIDALPPDSLVVRRSSQRIERALAAVLGIAFLGVSYVYFTAPSPEPEAPLRRFSFSAEGIAALTGGAISPNGKYILYAAQKYGESGLWLRSLSDESARELPGTEGAIEGFWSPDSSSIGFAVGLPDYELKRVSVNGSSPITLCELPAGSGFVFQGGTWSPDGERIVFSSRQRLLEIAARGGQAQLLFGEALGGLIRPHFLPTDTGLEALVYETEAADGSRIWVMNLETGERRELGPGSDPVYSRDGYLIHGPPDTSEGGLWAWPFSLATLEPIGDAFPISTVGRAAGVSREGTLAYLDRSGGAASRTLVWRNRAGELLETIGQPQPGMSSPALSPDDQRIAVSSTESGNPDIWVHDLIRSTKTRLTFGEGNEVRPAWSPSGREIAYVLSGSLMRKTTDGRGKAILLVESRSLQNPDWSLDDHYLVFQEDNDKTGTDIRYLDLKTDGATAEGTMFLGTPATERVAKLSPNGRFLLISPTNRGSSISICVRSPTEPASGRRL